MIYLIWWTPRCGKSSVAKLISKTTWISYIQTDYIASAIWSKMTESDEYALFWEKYRNDDNRTNNDTRFSVFSNQEQLEHYYIKAKWNRDGIKNIIEYVIADNESYIIEWFHLRPEIIKQNLNERWNKVRYVALYKSDVNEIEHWIQVNQHPNDRIVKNTYTPETYNKIASFIYDFWQLMKYESEKFWLYCYDMSIWDFNKNIQIVSNQLRKQWY